MTPIQSKSSRLPPALLISVVFVCLLPFLLHALGVDYSSHVPSLDANTLGLLPHTAQNDAIHRALAENFTHAILEWSAFCIAAFIAVLAMIHLFVKSDDITTPVIGMALFCAGGMDAFHALLAGGLIESAADTTNLVPLAWALTRSCGALVMLLGALLVFRRAQTGKGRPVMLVCATGVVLGLSAYAVIHTCAVRHSLPATMYPDSFITRPYDLVPLALFLVAGLFVYPLLHHRRRSFLTCALCLSAIPSIALQSYTALGSSSLFDNGFHTALLLKIAAYALPLAGLCLDYYVTYHDASISRAKLHAVISTAADGIITMDRRGTIESFNRAASLLFGYTEAEAVGMNITSLMPSPEQERSNEHIDSFFRTGRAGIIGVEREIEGVRHDGSVFPIELSVTEFEVGGRRLFTGLVRDIGNQKRLENELRMLSLVAEQCPAGILITDRNGTIEYVNPKFCETTGYAKEDVIGQNPRILKSGKWPKEAYASLWKTIGAGKTWRGEFHNRKKCGEFYWEAASISPMRNAQGLVTHFLAIKEDITKRKQTEEQLHEQNIQLIVKNRELDEFTYVASHDLREPLRKLISFSALLETDLGDDLPEKARLDLHFITNAAKRMETLVQDLLLLSRSGRAAMKRERISLNACVDGALDALAVAVRESGVRLERDDLPEVIADRTLVTQLFQNLIGNALKYRSPDRPPVIRITVEQTDEGAVFGVSDNGIGMEAQYLDQIFAPFKRLHGLSEFEGTGIGLAICRKVVERHGGRIWVESALGVGSHFKFTAFGGKETPQWTNELAGEPLSC